MNTTLNDNPANKLGLPQTHDLPEKVPLADKVSWRPPGLLVAGAIVLAVLATLGGLIDGPLLGEHEAIVAECARNMRVTGDWVVPWFMDTPFMRKPPLPYWLVAASSYFLPGDSVRGLPVTTMVARFPSALAGLGTVLVLWQLGSVMFGRRVGLITTVIAASSLVFMMFSPNATVEMLLTFCCTWAALHFWIAISGRTSHRRLHLFLFYVALGLGMLAKAPAPLAMLAVPLAVWWYTERPLRMIARGGLAGARLAPLAFLRGLKLRTIQPFTRLWLIPGLVVFALCFVPWMLAVAAKHPHAWDLWNWQYLQRAEGDYLDGRDRPLLYYLPIIIGFTIPWVFLLPEALIAPWLKRYARYRRPLLYCGLWAVIGITIMSVESFKKTYYMVPAMPPLILMMALVADRFYAKPPPWVRVAWIMWGVGAVALIPGLLVGAGYIRKTYPDATLPLMVVAVASAIALLGATAAYIRGRGWIALGTTAVASVMAFHAVWYVCGPQIADMGKVAGIAQSLTKKGVSPNARVFWADTRPDCRLAFYYGRKSEYLIKPAEIVDEMTERKNVREKLMAMALERAEQVLASPEPVYLILRRGHYSLVRGMMPARTYLIDSVHQPGEPAGDDWMLVSNVPPATFTP